MNNLSSLPEEPDQVGNVSLAPLKQCINDWYINGQIMGWSERTLAAA